MGLDDVTGIITDDDLTADSMKELEEHTRVRAV